MRIRVSPLTQIDKNLFIIKYFAYKFYYKICNTCYSIDIIFIKTKFKEN